MKIDEWSHAVHALAVERGWYEIPRTTVEAIALVHSELSEAIEAYRDRGLEEWTRDDGKPEGVLIELADAVIRIMDLCGSLEWSLEDAIERKHEFNRCRPHRHGGKKI